MSEQIDESTRLKIEDDLAAALSGDTLKNALDFVAHMKANGMATDDNHFEFAGDYVCQIITYKENDIPGWVIFMGGYDSVLCRGEYQDFPIVRI